MDALKRSRDARIRKRNADQDRTDRQARRRAVLQQRVDSLPSGEAAHRFWSSALHGFETKARQREAWKRRKEERELGTLVEGLGMQEQEEGVNAGPSTSTEQRSGMADGARRHSDPNMTWVSYALASPGVAASSSTSLPGTERPTCTERPGEGDAGDIMDRF